MNSYKNQVFFNNRSIKTVVAVILLFTMCLLLFAGCNNEKKTLYQSDSVLIEREGNKTVVYDLLADKEYNYIAKRVRRSESVFKPYTTVDTDTIKIEVLPFAVLQIYDKSADRVVTIRR